MGSSRQQYNPLQRLTNSARLDFAFFKTEAHSLLSRLEQVQPFSLRMPMVPAACIDDAALRAITDHLAIGTRNLRTQIKLFLKKIKENQANAKEANAAHTQATFALLKLRFNAILDQFDIFADVLSQRAEHVTGVWISGLDVLATDALQLPNGLYEAPPVMCFLDRGHGAAIRRARTRLPGGDTNPVAIIQVPRERMVGSGIAASLIHEVGHQGAALLNLVESLREAIRQEQKEHADQEAWWYYHLWISEIVADFWAIAHLGIAATQGLMNVVSLPRYFMFRIQSDDPHPFPWIRVRLSIAFGLYLFPHEQWEQLNQLWQRLYPMAELPQDKQDIIMALEKIMPQFVQLVSEHQNKALAASILKGVLPIAERQPQHLQKLYQYWKKQPEQMHYSAPSLVFAVIGQARADGLIMPQLETNILSKMLTRWAFQRSESRTTATTLKDKQMAQAIEKMIF